MSVVVASRQRRQRLRPFLQAVTADPAATEVVVVVDGDVDGSYPYLQELRAVFPTMRPILADSEGQMVALERGIEAATGEVVLLMDDDVVPDPGLISGHARHHAGATGLVVLGYMPVRLDPTSSPATRLYAAAYEGHCARLDSGELSVLDGLWLGNVSARRADLRRVGVSSDRFPVRWHADTDLGLRMGAAGLHGVFDRRLHATHQHAKTAEAFLRDNRERGRGAWLLESAHPERARVARTVPMLDGLPTPLRQMVSLLAREGRAEGSGRVLMAIGARAERMGSVTWSNRLARTAGRIEVVYGYRMAVAAAGQSRGGSGLTARRGRTPARRAAP